MNSVEETALIPFFQEFSQGNCPDSNFFQEFSRGNCPDSIFPGIQSRKLGNLITARMWNRTVEGMLWGSNHCSFVPDIVQTCFVLELSRGNCPDSIVFQEFSRGNCPDSIFARNSVEETALIPFFPRIQLRKLPWFYFFQEFRRGNCPDSISFKNSVEETALIPFFPGIQSRKLGNLITARMWNRTVEGMLWGSNHCSFVPDIVQTCSRHCFGLTDKKENQTFLIYKKIRKRSVAK
jgi:hypothetical protein